MPIESYLDTHPILGERIFLHASCQVIGDVILGDDVSVWCNTVLRGDVNHIRIGRGSNIQDLSTGHVTHKSPTLPNGHPLLIGENTTIGHQVILHGCTIGNRVLVGMGSIVMDGVTIEDEVMIGAGSLVPPGKHLASGYLYVGRPVKAVRPLTQTEREFLTYSAEHYVRVKNNYLNPPTHPIE